MKEKAKEIINQLEIHYPNVKGSTLKWVKPLDILIATILSAQSTDKQVNKVTESLFKKYKTAEDYAYASKEQLENDIKSTGFYHRKAEYIQEVCKTLVTDYGGKIPTSIDELIKLKGVARKTANIVLGNAFGIVEGIAVDTHVMRLSQRLGLTNQKNRDMIERDLMNIFPKSKWFELNYMLIEHGRKVCTAKRPDCENCFLKKICPSSFTFQHNKK